MLTTFPRAGEVYDPGYEASQLPGARVTYVEPYGIYYRVNDEEACVDVAYIEDQRRDPNLRFTD